MGIQKGIGVLFCLDKSSVLSSSTFTYISHFASSRRHDSMNLRLIYEMQDGILRIEYLERRLHLFWPSRSRIWRCDTSSYDANYFEKDSWWNEGWLASGVKGLRFNFILVFLVSSYFLGVL